MLVFKQLLEGLLNRAIWIFILITLSSFGALNILFPRALFNLLIASGIGVIVAYLDDLTKPADLAEDSLEEKSQELIVTPPVPVNIIEVPAHIVPRKRRKSA